MNNIILHTTRLFLGGVFLGAGLNGFVVLFGFEPFIATSPEAMAIFQFTYLLVFEKTIEIICGVLLLFNRFVPLALSLLAPIIVNIFLLHLFVDHSLLLLALLLVCTNAYLFYHFKNNFKGIFENKPL